MSSSRERRPKAKRAKEELRLSPTDDQVRELLIAFAALGGTIENAPSTTAVRVALRGLSREPEDDTEIARMLVRHGIPSETADSRVTWSQFRTLIGATLCSVPMDPVEVTRAFDAMARPVPATTPDDRPRVPVTAPDGRLRVPHLRAAARSCGLDHFTDEMLTEMIAGAAPGRDSCTVDETIRFLCTDYLYE